MGMVVAEKPMPQSPLWGPLLMPSLFKARHHSRHRENHRNSRTNVRDGNSCPLHAPPSSLSVLALSFAVTVLRIVHHTHTHTHTISLAAIADPLSSHQTSTATTNHVGHGTVLTSIDGF
jgi:hypothetical protein